MLVHIDTKTHLGTIQVHALKDASELYVEAQDGANQFTMIGTIDKRKAPLPTYQGVRPGKFLGGWTTWKEAATEIVQDWAKEQAPAFTVLITNTATGAMLKQDYNNLYDAQQIVAAIQATAQVSSTGPAGKLWAEVL